jgi:uncharacterized protein (DUF2267 family)
MPVPPEYLNSTRVFESFMVDARNESDLNTTNMAYNMVAGVLHTFRRRLSVRDALRFANVLPPAIRALFVADWDIDEKKLKFTDVSTMTQEVKALRAVHNWSPDTSIHDVAVALRRNVNEMDFDKLLSTLPIDAQNYWRV